MGSIFGGGGGGAPQPAQQSTSSSQYTGVINADKPALSRAIMQGIKFGIPQLTARFANPVPTPNAQGFLPEQMNAVNTLMSQAVGGMSSNFAQRGMLNPGHNEAVAGSALTQALPSLLPIISNNMQYGEQASSQRMSDLDNFIQMMTGAAGGSAKAVSGATGPEPPGIGYNFLNSLASSFGTRLGGGSGAKL